MAKTREEAQATFDWLIRTGRFRRIPETGELMPMFETVHPIYPRRNPQPPYRVGGGKWTKQPDIYKKSDARRRNRAARAARRKNRRKK